MKCPTRRSRARVACLALWAAALTACGGGGGGAAPTATDAASNPAVAPAAGVYLNPADTATALRPSWVAAVAAEPSPSPWLAWQAQADGDTRLYLGRVDPGASASAVDYFDATSVQTGQADLRASAADRLRGSVSGLGASLSVDSALLPDARLLSLAEVAARSWQGHWRHHGPTPLWRGEALNRTLGFSSTGSRLVFANQTILNCYVDAELSEHQAGRPGLFTLALTLAQIPGQASCSHIGSYQGLAVALRAAGGGAAQLRLAVADAATQRAISYVAQSP